jgi:preprotein translocase subunit SecA
VVSLGGLHIIGTERHEARRIDNQLRGRSGRQGDPGSSRFYLSLEDDLMRIFGSERISGLMQRLGMEEGVPIEHRMVTRAIEGAQKKVEAHNFDIRKQLIEYDDVMNKQREVIYDQRRHVLGKENIQEEIVGFIEEIAEGTLGLYCSEEMYPEQWDIKGLKEAFNRQFGFHLSQADTELRELGIEALRENLVREAKEAYEKKEQEFGAPLLRHIEKQVMLQVIDTHWKDHLLSMDLLKEGIGLRGYGQKDPLIEYKREGFDMFSAMIEKIQTDAVERLFRIKAVREEPVLERAAARRQDFQINRGESTRPEPTHRDAKKIGRNDPCPCGSGKKYKKCCGK